MRTDFNSTVSYCSKELTAKERLMIKNTTDATKIDEILEGGAFIIDVDYFAFLDIHNEKAKTDKDYKQTVIVARDGEKFVTSSSSFRNSLTDIHDEICDEGIEDFKIKVFRMASKNYTGKYFITCVIA